MTDKPPERPQWSIERDLLDDTVRKLVDAIKANRGIGYQGSNDGWYNLVRAWFRPIVEEYGDACAVKALRGAADFIEPNPGITSGRGVAAWLRVNADGMEQAAAVARRMREA